MQFDMEPIGLPSPSRTYQVVQKCCHGTWWLFGMVAIGVALRIADCPLYNFCCLVETIAPKKLTWVPVFIIYIKPVCLLYLYRMPFQAILIHLGFFNETLLRLVVGISCAFQQLPDQDLELASLQGRMMAFAYVHVSIYTNEILNAYYTHTCEYQSTDFLMFVYVYIYIVK